MSYHLLTIFQEKPEDKNACYVRNSPCSCWGIAITQKDKQSCMKPQQDMILELPQFCVNCAILGNDRKYCFQTVCIQLPLWFNEVVTLFFTV